MLRPEQVTRLKAILEETAQGLFVSEPKWTLERIKAGCRTDNALGCWEWTGEGWRDGYPTAGGEKMYRVAWSLSTKTHVPDGLSVCHSCHNRACVNPAHLTVGTHAANMFQTRYKNRLYSAAWREGVEYEKEWQRKMGIIRDRERGLPLLRPLPPAEEFNRVNKAAD